MKKLTYNIRIISCIFIFFVISIISIYSAGKITNSSLGNTFLKQIIYYIIGLVILFLAYYKKKEIIKHSFIIYLFINALLLLLLFFGININGSKCWLIIGPFSFQPSEFMKIFLIINIAKILNEYRSKKNIKKEFRMMLLVLLLLLIPSILTFLEPDTGVVLIYIIITISMLLYRGINKKWYLILLSILGIVGTIIIGLLLYDKNIIINFLDNSLFYRFERIFNWQNQSGYQLENSIISIASSGLFGFGLNKIPLYYPEASTDFIFTSFSSIFGFIGNIILFIVIIFFDTNILKIIQRKIKKTDEYILIGLLSMILYQQVQNISMTIGLLPITGITLPFISYGGSSLLSYMFIIGIILRISRDNYKYIN